MHMLYCNRDTQIHVVDLDVRFNSGMSVCDDAPGHLLRAFLGIWGWIGSDFAK